MPSHLQSYPKTFNPWGNLRAFPMREPVRYPYTFIGLASFTSLIGYLVVRSLFFSFFNRADAFQKDVTLL